MYAVLFWGVTPSNFSVSDWMKFSRSTKPVNMIHVLFNLGIFYVRHSLNCFWNLCHRIISRNGFLDYCACFSEITTISFVFTFNEISITRLIYPDYSHILVRGIIRIVMKAFPDMLCHLWDINCKYRIQYDIASHN